MDGEDDDAQASADVVGLLVPWEKGRISVIDLSFSFGLRHTLCVWQGSRGGLVGEIYYNSY